MAQLSLYMDEASMAALRADAAKRGVSISSFARDVLVERDAPPARAWEKVISIYMAAFPISPSPKISRRLQLIRRLRR